MYEPGQLKTPRNREQVQCKQGHVHMVVVGRIVSDSRGRYMVKWSKLSLEDSGKFCEASASNHLRDKTFSAIKSKGNGLEEM